MTLNDQSIAVVREFQKLADEWCVSGRAWRGYKRSIENMYTALAKDVQELAQKLLKDGVEA